MRILLIVLPYAALVLTAVSAIWGLTHELFTKGPDNKRYLTREGKYSIAFTLLGLVLSFNTAVLKTITDNQDKENAARILAQSEQKKAFEELTRQQQILFSISRGQYPLTPEFKITPVITISTKHPLFKNYSAQIQQTAQRFGNDKILVDEDSPLLPAKDSLARSYLTVRLLNFFVYKAGRTDVFKSPPDFSFAYHGDVLSENNNWNSRLIYRVSNSSFTTTGPTAAPFDVMHSTGKVVSYLDLPGSTLVIGCNDMAAGPNNTPSSSINCNEHIVIESLYITTPTGIQLEIRGDSFERVKEGEFTYLVHRFDPDVEHFFETYLKRD